MCRSKSAVRSVPQVNPSVIHIPVFSLAPASRRPVSVPGDELDAGRFQAQFDLLADEKVRRRLAVLEGPCDQNQKPVADLPNFAPAGRTLNLAASVPIAGP